MQNWVWLFVSKKRDFIWNGVMVPSPHAVGADIIRPLLLAISVGGRNLANSVGATPRLQSKQGVRP